MNQFSVAAALCLAVAACGPRPDTIFFEEPSDSHLVGSWSGFEEITTDNDITSNINFPGPAAGGFSFPVMIRFDDASHFTLFTSNYPTSAVDESARSCSGVYTHTNAAVHFFPAQECRALPMSKFALGRTLPAGISLEARTNMSASALASYASVHVRFNLERE
ncbi:MAG TPA: hypothetical protein VF021_05275 [Longimicrobiales bacterium]